VGDLSLEIASGEIVVLAGPSGCGKTTSLTMINRLVEPSSGPSPSTGGTPPAWTSMPCAAASATSSSRWDSPPPDVAENIATVPRLAGWNRRRIAARVEELLEMSACRRWNTAGVCPPNSAGRTSAGRSGPGAGRRPEILLMDEPFEPSTPWSACACRTSSSASEGPPQDHRLRHPRHRRGGRIGDRVALLSQEGCSSSTPARSSCSPTPPPLRGPVSRRRPHGEAAGAAQRP